MARLFQPSAKSGFRWMTSAEGLDRGRAVAAVHLLDADLQQPVDLRVAGAAPHLPHRVLGERPHHRSGSRSAPISDRGVCDDADLAEPGGGAPARLQIGLPEVGQRLLPGERGLVLGRPAPERARARPSPTRTASAAPARLMRAPPA